jgi:LysM repeat protein
MVYSEIKMCPSGRACLNRAYLVVRLLPFALLLLTAGCFRSAGESIEPTSGVVLPLASPTSPPTLVLPSDTPVELPEIEPSPTATIPTITVIAPTETATLESEASPESGIGLTAPTDEEPAFPTLIPATSTPRFITPGSPLGPVTPDTPTPTLDAPPTSTPSGLITPTSLPGTEDDDCAYIVQPGDNLYRIATERGFTVDDMLDANPDLTGDPPILQVGQTLQLPECETDTSQPNVQATPSLISTSPVTSGGTQVYIVQPGDTLYGIALRFGITVQSIVDANSLPNPDRLDVGQQLIIPPPTP